MSVAQGIAATAGSAPAHRQFSFFNVVPVKDIHDLASPPEIFKITPEISCMTSSSAGILVADIHGSVHLLNKDFEVVTRWIVHVGGRVTHMIEKKGILLTLGEEDTVRSPLIQMWDLERSDKKTGTPLLLRSTKVQPSNRPHPVSTVALSATLSHLAIGLADGTVLLYRHLDQSLSSSTSLTAIPKPRTVHEDPTEPITGLGFKEPTEENPYLYLFVVTTNRVLVYQVSGKGSSNATVVDEVGCGLGCATMDWRKKDVVIARDEAIYLCGTEGRGSSYAYEGHKSSIHTHLNYVVIVSPPFIPSASAASATVRKLVERSPNITESDITKVTVLDHENKLIAYSGTFTDGVREIVSQWGQIYIVTNNGRLISLQEKSTSEKLSMLYSKGQYLLALNVAKSQKLDEGSAADIRRQYGDSLYLKADYDAAMQQYVQTIGQVQPSYVIRKFLDAQRIHNLVTYLQELHSAGLANSDHTTLLLNTYTKLKDVSRLDSFIRTESRRTTTNAHGEEVDELPFDLETAIRVCRQAGYFEHASYLAKKYERHEDYLRIQIEDAGNYKDALEYLRVLGAEAAESNLARYGRAMLENLPTETTQLLIDLCTTTGSGSLNPTKPDEETAPTNQPKQHAVPSYLSYLALNRNSTVAPALTTSDTATIGAAPSIKTLRAGDHSRQQSVYEPQHAESPSPPDEPPSPPKIKYLSPRLYFAHFVDHMENFVVFLETVALKRWGQSVDERLGGSAPTFVAEAPEDEDEDEQDQIAVWNTLLELYLTLPQRKPGAEFTPDEEAQMKTMRGKALRVLKTESIPYNATHGLILCSSRNYTEGLVLLWEKMGMHDDVLRFWMDQHNAGSSPDASAQVVHYLEEYGVERPHLYPLVLRFLTSTGDLLSKHNDDVKRIVRHIDEEGIMPPLGVVQALSHHGVASVGLIKEWLLSKIKESKEEIRVDREFTTSYRMETEQKLTQVKKLTDSDNAIVFHVTRCSSCGGQLDLPSIHFMCEHSYHGRCLQDNDAECPLCVRRHGDIMAIRRNNEQLADQHDLFLSGVQENGFSAVAGAFSRGLLNMRRGEVI